MVLAGFGEVSNALLGGATHVSGGTLEAKRVKTHLPEGMSPGYLPDEAAGMTWTACDTATLAYSK